MAETNKSLDDQIKEAELQRIKAETRRIEEERKELERKNNLPWYRRSAFFQAVVAGLIAIPAIWFFVANIVFPSLNTKNIKLAYQNELRSDSLRKASESLKKARIQYKAEIDSLKIEKTTQAQKHLAELNQIKTAYFEIDSIRKVLAAKYERLSQTQGLTQQERDEAKKNLDSLQARNKAQEDKVSKLASQIAQQKQKAASFLSGQAEILVSDLFISSEDVANMIKRNDYYDSSKNPGGKGISHQYEVKTLSGKEVVFDHTTNLVWQQSGSLKPMSYQEATRYIDQLNRDKFAGFNDWRLPTLKEAMSLMEPKISKEGLFIDSVFDQGQTYIWTADNSSASRAWFLRLNDGACNPIDVETYYGSVRAVRSL